MDETHTLICGPGGLVRRWGLRPDIVTMGKSIGAGVPIGAYGMTAAVSEVFERVEGVFAVGEAMDELATGGTLFGNHLQMAAARAALTQVLTDEAYERTGALGGRVADGIEEVGASAGLPWKAHRLFARSGYMLDGRLPRNAEEFLHAHDSELMQLMRVFMANRGVWEAIEFAGPAVGVAAVEADVDRYLEVLVELVAELTG
jgi:glutamate-1-semialdehyde 2,1-aminomutase